MDGQAALTDIVMKYPDSEIERFCLYLRDTLEPDLTESGMFESAVDFKTARQIIEQLKDERDKARKSPRGQLPESIEQ